VHLLTQIFANPLNANGFPRRVVDFHEHTGKPDVAFRDFEFLRREGVDGWCVLAPARRGDWCGVDVRLGVRAIDGAGNGGKSAAVRRGAGG